MRWFPNIQSNSLSCAMKSFSSKATALKKISTEKNLICHEPTALVWQLDFGRSKPFHSNTNDAQHQHTHKVELVA
jgi:hypothetical protein